MAIDSLLRVGGTAFAWNSSLFRIEGLLIEGVVGMSGVGEKLERPLVYGARRGGTALGRAGGGKYTPPSFKLKMLKDTAVLVKTSVLAPLGLGSYGFSGIPGFTFQAQVVEETNGLVVVTANASGCVVEEVARDAAEGAEQLFEEWTISALDFIENGVPLWSVSRQSF